MPKCSRQRGLLSAHPQHRHYRGTYEETCTSPQREPEKMGSFGEEKRVGPHELHAQR